MFGDYLVNGIIAATFWASTFLNAEASLINGLDVKSQLAEVSFSVGEVSFQGESIGNEVTIFAASPHSFGPLQPTFSLSVTDQGGTWFGYGFLNTLEISEKSFAKFRFMPGVYSAGNDVELGGWLMFKSEIELGFEINEFWAISLGYDHRSSGDIWEYNPGMETVQLKVTRQKF